MKFRNDSLEREIGLFTNLDEKQQLALNNHIQTVSRVDDYDQRLILMMKPPEQFCLGERISDGAVH